MYPLGNGKGWGLLSSEEIAARKVADAKDQIAHWRHLGAGRLHNLSSGERRSVSELERFVRQYEPAYAAGWT